jgi:hypothetical protein
LLLLSFFSLLSPHCVFLSVPSPFIQYNANIWYIVEICKIHSFSSFAQVKFIFAQIIRSSEYVKLDKKSFIDKKGPAFSDLSFSLHHKNWTAQTQSLFINITCYVFIWLMLSCEIHMLLWNSLVFFRGTLYFSKIVCEIIKKKKKKEMTKQWLQINFFPLETAGFRALHFPMQELMRSPSPHPAKEVKFLPETFLLWMLSSGARRTLNLILDR